MIGESESADNSPKLLPQHLAGLRESGLLDGTIRAAGLYSESDPKQIAKLLGWRDARRLGAVLCIPYMDATGQPTGLVRVRPDNPRTPRGKKSPAKYESPKGATNRAYIPPGTRAAIADDIAPLLMTEGEKKALAADQAGLPCIGLSGVWNWQAKRERDDDDQPRGPRKLIPDLSAIPWSQRRVYLIFDSDILTKPEVQWAEWHLARTLKAAGAEVRVVRLPAGPDGRKMGLDDHILAHGADALKQLMTEARAPVKPVPPVDELSAVDDPHRLAAGFLASIDPLAKRRLRRWRDEWMMYRKGAYRPIPESYLRARLADWTRSEFLRAAKQELDAWTGEGDRPRPRKVTSRLLTDTLLALQGIAILSYRVESPCWIGERSGANPRNLIAMRNGILDLARVCDDRPGSLTPPTTDYFTETALPYRYEPEAQIPVEWLKFLASVWPNDPESIACLQEWMGYLLTADTSQQKALFLIGPPRSGKGTILRVLKAMVGEDNVCAPALGSLASEFGLAPLLGRSVALVSDARISGRTDTGIIVERLLSIIGEDNQTVNRKHRDQITVKLGTRIVIATNELPKLNDASSALASRFIVVRFTESFLGREDHGLTDRLLCEMPGILLWAIRGLRRLRDRGRFAQPESGGDLLTAMKDLTSPVNMFLRERCVIEAGARVETTDLYLEWKGWCESNGKKEPGTLPQFSPMLFSAAPSVTRKRPRTSEGRIQVYTGIRLRTAADPDPGDEPGQGGGQSRSGSGQGPVREEAFSQADETQGNKEGGQGGQGDSQLYRSRSRKQQDTAAASSKSRVETAMPGHPDHPDHPDQPDPALPTDWIGTGKRKAGGVVPPGQGLPPDAVAWKQQGRDWTYLPGYQPTW